MKLLKSILLTVLALPLFFGNVNAQIVGSNCFLMGINQEVGIHSNGYEFLLPSQLIIEGLLHV
jgi:hypothetical protein